MTALGSVELTRSHGYCRACSEPGFAADGVVGIDGRVTPRAARMATLAGINDPFRKADTLLEELCGWRVCPESVRQLCHRHAADLRGRRAELSGLAEGFEQAEGEEYEIQIDAGKVNTPTGWRDVKLAVLARRKRGEAGTLADYEQRTLPDVSVRSVVAEVEGVGAFGPRCLAEAVRVGVPTEAAGPSVLGDGAEWIWNLAEEPVPDGDGGVGLLPRRGEVGRGRPRGVWDGYRGDDALVGWGERGLDQRRLCRRVQGVGRSRGGGRLGPEQTGSVGGRSVELFLWPSGPVGVRREDSRRAERSAADWSKGRSNSGSTCE